MPTALDLAGRRAFVLLDGRRAVSPRFAFKGYDDDVHGPFVRPFLDPDGKLPSVFTALLLDADDGPLLVDAGVGRFAGDLDAGHLRAELDALGIRPDEIRTVLITHAHADHVGGLTDAAGAPVFANARHVCHRAEAAFWGSPEARDLPGDAAAPAVAAFEALVGAGLLHLIDDDEAVAHGVTALPAPGHTPGHLAVAIDGACLWTGDAIVGPLNVTHPQWVSAADMDGPANEATRRALLARAADEDLLLGGNHLPAPMRVRRDGDGFAIVGGWPA
jgi:glyoxylase-like metal-dependent hydrolase (beta-lactamase superfamily II)